MNFKEARDKAMTEKFAETYGKPPERQPKNAPIAGVPVSMGASVPEPTCSLCWGREPHVHFSPLMAREGVPSKPFYVVDPSPTFLYATTVPAPKCEGCRVEMSRYDSTNWECREATCSEHREPVPAHLSGIYPSKIISEPGR